MVVIHQYVVVVVVAKAAWPYGTYQTVPHVSLRIIRAYMRIVSEYIGTTVVPILSSIWCMCGIGAHDLLVDLSIVHGHGHFNAIALFISYTKQSCSMIYILLYTRTGISSTYSCVWSSIIMALFFTATFVDNVKVILRVSKVSCQNLFLCNFGECVILLKKT